MKRCKFVEETPKVNGKYEVQTCKIMRWTENERPVMCNGWKSACLGLCDKIYDVRDRRF